MLVDSTRLAIPTAFRRTLLDREHVAHQGINKTIITVAAKYIWPGYEQDIKETCASCGVCQRHGRSQPSQPNRLALEFVTRPMSLVGLHIFFWKGKTYLIMVEHFSGLPMSHLNPPLK